jgi:hypothetical protein
MFVARRIPSMSELLSKSSLRLLNPVRSTREHQSEHLLGAVYIGTRRKQLTEDHVIRPGDGG